MPLYEGVYAGVPTVRTGMVSVHDHKRSPRALVLCAGSMTHVPIANAIGWQDELPEPSTDIPPPAAAPTLF
ncbi:hypothetical protein ACFT38_27835 [Streptomyces sp. NPDC056975]|uniref:hypothetical protein n=1 Tax=Streptomyces sp. NPDC056975 TaxID=3345985 RepID=UPI00363DD2B2